MRGCGAQHTGDMGRWMAGMGAEVSREVAGASLSIYTPLRLRKELKEGFQNEYFQPPLNKNASFLSSLTTGTSSIPMILFKYYLLPT